MDIICTPIQMKLCGRENCTTCHIRSLASYDKVKVDCFSNENEMTVYELRRGSRRNVCFNCNRCQHHFEMCPNKVTSGKWCPFCANKKLCNDDCETCNSKSCAFNERILAGWSSNNLKPVHQVFLHSNRQIKIDCSTCNHEFSITPSNVTHGGNWCPFCSNQKLCDNIGCQTCLSKTCASDEKMVRSWSSTNKLTPREVTLHSGIVIEFVCDNNHTFKSTVANIYNGQWCPCPLCVRNKAMSELTRCFKTHTEIQGFTFEQRVKIRNRNLRWDMVVEHRSRVFHIESDGPQHFSADAMRRVSRNSGVYQTTFEDQVNKDRSKDNHITTIPSGLLFRISYRQTRQIENLVDEMIQMSNDGITGVIYMDKRLYSEKMGVMDKLMANI